MVSVVDIISTAGEAVKLYAEAQPLGTWFKGGMYTVAVGTGGWVLYKWISPTWKRIAWKPNNTVLQGKVAVVTGASRGVGKGIALGLAEAGATVYVTGRTEKIEQGVTLEGTIHETAVQVNGLGGKGIAVVCDHSKDEDVAALFDRVLRDHGKIDILVNNAFQMPDIDIAANAENFKFWESGTKLWDPIMNVGLRSHYIAACHAGKAMVKQNDGIIINISSVGAKYYTFCVGYGVCKAALDRMTSDMAHELKGFKVTVISLWPGLVKTERMLQHSEYFGHMMKVDLKEKGESPIYTGRAVAALCADTHVHKKTGKVLTNEQAAKEYGFTDIDGRQPHSIDCAGFWAEHWWATFTKKIGWTKPTV